MREGDEWEPLAFKLQDPDIRDALPFVTFNAPLKGNETGEQLKKAYHALLEVARGVHKSYLSPDPDVEGLYSETDTTSSEDEDDRDGEVGFSYNLAFTTKLITIMPRTAEGVTMTYDLVHGEKTEVQLNGTVLGGTLLVKDRGAYDAMMNEDEEDGIELGGILDQVGVPQRALASLLAGQVRH